MLAKANCSVCICDQKNNKNWLSLSREDDCMVPERDKISCAEKLRASKILTTANQKSSAREREREKKREKERACNTHHHPASHI